MTTVALLHPDSLVGKEVQERLQQTEEPWWDDLRLLTTDSDVAGTLTEIRGSAALVQNLTADSLSGVDLLIDTDPEHSEIEFPLDDSGDRTIIQYSPNRVSGAGIPVVAGVNLEAASKGKCLISPHPGSIAIALILRALEQYGLKAVTGTVIQPVSMLGAGALDELFAQARSILTFSGEMPDEILGSQLVFNLIAENADLSQEIDRQLETILDLKSTVSVQLVQGGFFHGVGISLNIELDESAEPTVVLSTLEKSTHLAVRRDAHPPVGPASIVGSEEVVLRNLRPVEGLDNAYWVWGAMDNLTRGSAYNMVEIAEHLMSRNGN